MFERRWAASAIGALAPLAAAAMVLITSGWSTAARPVASGGGRDASWTRLPTGARGQVSASLGSVQPAYWVRHSPGGLLARSPEQRLTASFAHGGVSVTSGASWFGLRLAAVGFGTSLHTIAAAVPRAHGSRVTYIRPGLTEWYANGPFGLEQGFTVARPAGDGLSPLTLRLALSGNLHAALADAGHALTLDGELAYRDLAASDARGRVLHSWLELQAGRLDIRVDARGASYPVKIDPILQQAKLAASDGSAGAGLGSSMAVAGDGSVVVAGAPAARVDGRRRGAVYVFVRPAGGWASGSQTARVTAPGSVNLGASVSVSADGSTVAAGAPGVTIGDHRGQGAVYVFLKGRGGWRHPTLHAALIASDGDFADHLGASVAVSADGSAVVAGAPTATVGDNSSQGSAYVFVRPPAGWASEPQAAKLTAADGDDTDFLGRSVTVSADGGTVLAGAPGATVASNPGAGAAYAFVRPSGGWTSETQAAKLTSSDAVDDGNLGASVSVSGDGATAVAGAPGATVNSRAQGAAYVFVRPAGGWSSEEQNAELIASNGRAQQGLGSSAAISADGSTVLSGVPNADRAYVFIRLPSGWRSETQAAELVASDDADRFGASVALSADGSARVVGAPGATVRGHSNRGAAYVYHPREGHGLQLPSRTVDVFDNRALVALRCASPRACNGTLSIVVHDVLLRTHRLITIHCTSRPAPAFHIAARASRLLLIPLLRGCLAELSSAPTGALAALLDAHLRTGQRGLTEMILLKLA